MKPSTTSVLRKLRALFLGLLLLKFSLNSLGFSRCFIRREPLTPRLRLQQFVRGLEWHPPELAVLSLSLFLWISGSIRALSALIEDWSLLPAPTCGWQPLTTSVPGSTMLSSGFCRHCTHVIQRHSCRQTLKVKISQVVVTHTSSTST